MTSLINPYFHKNRSAEQALIEGFNRESIQLMGETYFYLPREIQVEDLILGEDVVSRFGIAIPIEMYLIDTQGFQGDREMFSKFGLNIQNSYKLVVNKTRWEEEVAAMFDNGVFNLIFEQGGKVIIENSITYKPSFIKGELADSKEADFDIDNYIRPREGDLIYDPTTKFLFEIKLVDHDVEFFALGRNYQYYLSCEAFQYQNEIIETGTADIDKFEWNSKDGLSHQFITDGGFTIILEQGGYLIQEAGNWADGNRKDFHADFVAVKETINFTAVNPFGL